MSYEMRGNSFSGYDGFDYKPTTGLGIHPDGCFLMSYIRHGYDLVARGLVQALGGILNEAPGFAPARAVPAGLTDLCRQAGQWDWALRVDMPAGNFSCLEKLVGDRSVPVSIRRRVANNAILYTRHLVDQKQFGEAEHLAQEALKLSPGHPGIGNFLGHVFYCLGRTRQAREWFDREPDWRSCRTAYTLSHCMVLIELHDFGHARILLDLLSDMESSPDPLPRLQFRLLTALLPNGGLARGMVAATQEPLVPTALHPYSTFLMRRAESPDASSFDQHAVRILTSAMLEEHEINPYPNDQRISLARWLILAGRPGKALQLIEEQVRRSTAIADSFSILCVCLWISGETSLAQQCLLHADCVGATSDKGWFIRSVACSVAGDVPRATACLSSLSRQAPGFFMTQPGATVWGMLALTLKALGQERLAHRARALAAQEDYFDEYRAHLWERIPISTKSLPLPNFRWPSCFYE